MMEAPRDDNLANFVSMKYGPYAEHALGYEDADNGDGIYSAKIVNTTDFQSSS